MLAARASTARNISRTARSFVAVHHVCGFKIAARDHNQPTTTITLLTNAGSRFEPKPGVAHALKNFAFKSTAKRSALGSVRESELYGGVLSSTLSREHLALTAEFLRGDEAFFVDLLTSFITSAKFSRHEFEEYVLPTVEAEAKAASTSPATHAIELAHALAFRSGLGSSLFASSHHSITVGDIDSFATSTFTKDNVAILGTGIDATTLTHLVGESVGHTPESPEPTTIPPSSYFGGETRLEAHGGPQTVFIGFGATGAPVAELAAFSAHLSPQPSIKWSRGLSPIAASIPEGTTVQSVYLPYSDATLLGFLVQGPTAAGVAEAGKAAVRALKAAAATGGVKGEELKRAVAKAKFAAASATDSNDGLISGLGSVLTDLPSPLESTLSSLDKITATAFSKAASTLVKGKPTYVAIGDVKTLPYPDELGL